MGFPEELESLCAWLMKQLLEATKTEERRQINSYARQVNIYVIHNNRAMAESQQEKTPGCLNSFTPGQRSGFLLDRHLYLFGIPPFPQKEEEPTSLACCAMGSIIYSIFKVQPQMP